MIPRSYILPEHVNVRTKWIAERSLRAGSVRFHCVQEAPDFEFWSIFTVSYSLDPYHCLLYACMEKGVENSYFLFSLFRALWLASAPNHVVRFARKGSVPRLQLT